MEKWKKMEKRNGKIAKECQTVHRHTKYALGTHYSKRKNETNTFCFKVRILSITLMERNTTNIGSGEGKRAPGALVLPPPVPRTKHVLVDKTCVCVASNQDWLEKLITGRRARIATGPGPDERFPRICRV